MRVNFEPFAFPDLLDLEIQPRHARIRKILLANMIPLKSLMEGPYSWTAWSAHGRPLACCGILADGRTWALLSPRLGQAMKPVSQAVRAVLEAHPGTPWADIDPSYLEAVRWARMLGFRPTGAGPWIYEPTGDARECSRSETP